MATGSDVVAAIEHVMHYKPGWRGTLSDADFTALNDLYEKAKAGRIDPGFMHLDDKYLGALRLDNPTLFNGVAPVDPSGPPAPTQPASVDAPPAAPSQPPPAATPDDEFSGKAAEASKLVDEALAKNKTALSEADEELVDAVLGAKTGSDEGKAQLRTLQSSLVDQIHKLGPTMDTPAGQQQLNDFLQGKTQEILGIVKSSSMDAKSKADVLGALSQRYDAVKDSAGKTPGSTDPASQGGNATSSTDPSPPATSAGTTAAPPASDPLLDGLASDPLMGGLGGLAGPAMGALSGLPGSMGSMMPGLGGFGGGGGLPLNDLRGAIKDAVAQDGDDRSGQHASTEPPTTAPDKADPSPAPTEKKDGPPTVPAAGKADEGGPAAPVAAQTGQVPPAQPAPDVSVKLPDGTSVTADTPQLAHVGRLVLQGAGFDDAAGQAQITVLPPGAPVNEPVSPSQLKFGDYAQFTDHRVMALGGGKVWLNGQVSPIEEMPTGSNFLGWARPQVQSAQNAPPATLLAAAH